MDSTRDRSQKPIIIAVDDEPAVLGAVARDLRRQYGEYYRIQRAPSGEEALELVKAARLRNDAVALLLADQRMPGMQGLEFLTLAKELYPEAKRVLLTAYADTEASIKAINETRLDYYLMKPWDPPEERLYPVLTDLLDDWLAGHRPPQANISLIGHPFSAATHTVKDFLARNLVPYRWLDVEASKEAEDLMALASAGPSDLPLVLLPDGSSLVRPTTSELAQRIGLKTSPDMQLYDLLIVGGGPAGLAAAVYGASEGLSTLLVEAEAPGGQAGMSSAIENYLGFPAGLSGGDLARRAVTQARRFGAEILTPLTATALRRQDPYRFVTLSDGSEVAARTLLISTGVSYRTLDAPGADQWAGAGVYYGAAITEALSAKDGDVFVVGGGNSAGQAAMYLTRFARSVTMLVRGSSLAASMSRYLIAQIEQNDKIRLRFRSSIASIEGDTRLRCVTLANLDDDRRETLDAAAIFVFIGAVPRTAWLDGAVALGPQGYVLSGREAVADSAHAANWNLEREPFWLETNVPGVFVAGDVRHRSVKRIASAVGEGAMAVQSVHQHLAGG